MSAQESKMTRRDFLRLSAAVGGASLLAACAPKPTPAPAQEPTKEAPAAATSAPTAPPAPKEPAKIRIMSRGGDYIAEVFDKQIEAFTKIHPEIQIEQEQSTGAHHEKLLLEFAAGTAPDTYFDANRTTGLLVKKGVALDLEPFLEVEPGHNEDDFYSKAWIAQTYENKRWGLGWDSGGMAVAFDIEIFERAGLDLPDHAKPVTWNELVELAKQLTLDFNDKHPGEAGFDPTRIKQYGYKPDTGHAFFSFVYENGGEVSDSDGSVPIDSPEAIEAVQWVADLGLVHFCAPSPAYEQSTTMDMRSKNVAMQDTGVWMLGRLNDAGVKWGTMPFAMNKVQVTYGHYSPLSVCTQSKYKQQAFTWIYWACCSKEGEKMLLDLGMQQPMRKDLTEEFLSSPNPPERKYRENFVTAFDDKTFRYPGDKIGSYFGSYRQPWIDLWGPYLDRVFAGNARFEEVAAELREKTEYLLKTGEVT